jgi:GntR family transcriptional regulator
VKLEVATDKPIFIQIAEAIEDAIVTGVFPEQSQIPSTTEISVSYKINPATVLKGMNILVDEGVIYKKRGLGMFVSSGAGEKIRFKRKTQFYDQYVDRMLAEARKLGLVKEEIIAMVERGFGQ